MDCMTMRDDRGRNVRKIQERLRELGYTLQADGIFGPITERAVKQFQESKGIDADGIVGPITWGKLWSTDASDEDEEQPDEGEEQPEEDDDNGGFFDRIFNRD